MTQLTPEASWPSRFLDQFLRKQVTWAVPGSISLHIFYLGGSPMNICPHRGDPLSSWINFCAQSWPSQFLDQILCTEMTSADSWINFCAQRWPTRFLDQYLCTEVTRAVPASVSAYRGDPASSWINFCAQRWPGAWAVPGSILGTYLPPRRFLHQYLRIEVIRAVPRSTYVGTNSSCAQGRPADSWINR